MDESGTPDVPGNTSHYVLVGVSIPAENWKDCDAEIQSIKRRYDLTDQEIHVAWILRRYLEQSQIPGFEGMSRSQRRSEAQRHRTAELLRLQRVRNTNQYKQTKKNYQKTEPYTHLTFAERQQFITDVAKRLSGWTFARLFAECVDKVHFDPARAGSPIEDQAFEQIVTRFESYLHATSTRVTPKHVGLLVHDNNETVAKKHTELMKKFHDRGTQWRNLEHVVETPLFVSSELTGMVQVADLCGYALRRYLENGEEDLFDLVFARADRIGPTAVGVRHFTRAACLCKICAAHRAEPRRRSGRSERAKTKMEPNAGG